jgi:hypothetical protein
MLIKNSSPHDQIIDKAHELVKKGLAEIGASSPAYEFLAALEGQESMHVIKDDLNKLFQSDAKFGEIRRRYGFIPPGS